jgi:hypothetical protein
LTQAIAWRQLGFGGRYEAAQILRMISACHH